MYMLPPMASHTRGVILALESIKPSTGPLSAFDSELEWRHTGCALLQLRAGSELASTLNFRV